MEAVAKDGNVSEEETEESRRPRIARRPQTPTKAEYESHMTLHAEQTTEIGVRTVLQEEASVTNIVHRRTKEQAESSVSIMPL